MSWLTVVHDGHASLVINERRKWEYTDFGGQFRVVRFNELYTVFVGVVVNGLEFLEDFRARFAFIIVC